jgi:hypothetical protein
MTTRIGQPSQEETMTGFRGFSDTGNLNRKVIQPGLYQGQQMQIVLLPHDKPIAIVDISDLAIRDALDDYADRNGLDRDEAVTVLLATHLETITNRRLA